MIRHDANAILVFEVGQTLSGFNPDPEQRPGAEELGWKAWRGRQVCRMELARWPSETAPKPHPNNRNSHQWMLRFM